MINDTKKKFLGESSPNECFPATFPQPFHRDIRFPDLCIEIKDYTYSYDFGPFPTLACCDTIRSNLNAIIHTTTQIGILCTAQSKVTDDCFQVTLLDVKNRVKLL